MWYGRKSMLRWELREQDISLDFCHQLTIILVIFCLIDLRERERERPICCSSYLCIDWLIPVCALTGNRTATLVYPDNTLTS